MRPISILSGLALLAAGTVAAGAETEKEITVPQVEVRSGPSTQYYVTSILRQGDKVKVLKEQDGWLAIEPPPGSYSWINTLFLPHDRRNGPGFTYVLGEDAPVRVGSSVVKDEPTHMQVKLKRGTVVEVLDARGAATQEGNWLPIKPPATEYRYIPPEAVKPMPQTQTVNASPPSAPSSPPPAAAGSLAHTPADQALLAQAEAAERSGNTHEARRLYHQLSRQTSEHDLQMLCHNRDVFLSHGHRASVPPGYQPGMPSTASYPPTPNAGPAQAYPAVQPITPPSGVRSDYVYYRETLRRPPTPAYTTSYTASTPAAPASPTQSSGPGWLRHTSFYVDGKPAYALVTDTGDVIMYVTAGANVNLEGHVGRRVDLTGPVTYRGDLYHKNYMSAVQAMERP